MTVKHPRLQKPKPSTQRPKYDRLVFSNPDAVQTGVAEDLIPIYRKAAFGQNSFDEATYTISAVFSTFAPVARRGYVERLDPAGLDMDGIVGAPVLDGHRSASGVNVIGIIQSARIESGQLVGTIRLVQSDDAKPIVDRIRQGFLRDCSIGYRVQTWADSTDPETGERSRTAVRWSVFELSCVPIGADPGAKFRSATLDPELENENVAMPEADQTAIRSLGELADLPPSWAAGQIASNATVAEARMAARDELTRRSASQPRIRVQSPPMDDPAVRFRAFEEALAVRVIGGTPSDAARPYVSHTLRDFARETLAIRGISTVGMDADTLFRQAMHTTSDFQNLLTGVGNRTLLPAYQAAQSPLKSVLSRQATRSDFRAGTSLQLSELGLLKKVSESGEIQSTTRSEAAASYSLDTYGSLFTISRKALINNDLGAFRDWGTAAGQAAAQTEAALLFSLLTQSSGAGPVMGEDGKRLFHSDHGNLDAVGDWIDTQSLSAARLALRNMKGLDGKTKINVTPKYLLVGPALETAAELALTAVTPNVAAYGNPFAGKLELLVEPRIEDTAWYLFADPATLPVFEHSYLAGASGPQLASRDGFEVLATEYRVHLDFGCGTAGPGSWRGVYRNVGSADPNGN